ncbi:MAG: molybdopterin-dependent oxidoreductase, partial [Burkholderiales bacterium]
MIDLCPVGALTSKPFRYSARTWELSRRKSIAPHDGLGANLVVQVKQDRVMRVLPLENEAVNECWLSDRDRFSYEALNSADRLTVPLVKTDGKWMETDWQSALQTVADGLARAKQQGGADHVAVMASPSSTLEELHLLGKLSRSLGAKPLTTRHRQRDAAVFGKAIGAQWLGTSLTNIGNLQSILLLGSTLRKEQPLLATRFRAAAKRGAHLNVLHSVDSDLLMRVANKSIVKPENLAAALGAVAKALAEIKNAQLPSEVADAVATLAVSVEARAIASSLAAEESTGVFLGHYAQQHPQATTLHVLAQEIARLAGGVFGVLAQAANSVGAAVVGADAAVPSSAKAYVLLNVEPEADCVDAVGQLAALKGAEFVVAMSMFKNSLAAEYATVMLPIAPFSETAGTFVNMEGKAQSFNGVVKPLGQTRPAWKVIRVLGNLLGLSGFDQDNIEAVRADIAPDLNAFVAGRLNNQLSGVKVDIAACAAAAQMSDVPIYGVDS